MRNIPRITKFTQYTTSKKTQPATKTLTMETLTIEKLEQSVKYVES